MRQLAPGPVMLDVSGTALDLDDRRRLEHAQCGGVILFSRNFESVEQLTTLCDEIRAFRDPPLLIAVDHEGGRVQRFRKGFTAVPPMRELGRLWDSDRPTASASAELVGYLIGRELGRCGVDFSFTPVLDLDWGRSTVIGNRALHRDPIAVAELGGALIRGLARAGVAAVAKHFPGHGYAEADSHLDVARDDRTLQEMETADLVPFARLVPAGLSAVMPAHVIYPAVDSRPAGYSRVWLKQILRGRLGFDGLIFSDDLSMEGAGVAGGIVERAQAAMSAGCDMVLVCNRPDFSDRLLDALGSESKESAATRLIRLRRRNPSGAPDRLDDDAYQAARREVVRLASLAPGRPA